MFPIHRRPDETLLEHRIHTVFVLGVLLKGLDGVLEILAGFLLFFGSGLITGIIQMLVHNELLEDPHDLVALYVQHLLPAITANAGFFALAYLISHGLVKLFLVIGLLREKPWAYPVSIIIFSLFILFQMYRYTLTHALFLLVLSVLDLFVIALTWHEYRYFKKYRVFPA